MDWIIIKLIGINFQFRFEFNSDNGNFTKFLIEHGADINARDRNGGDTALHSAARYGNANTARVLIEHGADINLENNYQESPFYTALCYGIP